jgi:hypothetical protein
MGVQPDATRLTRDSLSGRLSTREITLERKKSRYSTKTSRREEIGVVAPGKTSMVTVWSGLVAAHSLDRLYPDETSCLEREGEVLTSDAERYLIRADGGLDHANFAAFVNRVLRQH